MRRRHWKTNWKLATHLLLACSCLLSAAQARADNIRPFTADSFKEIVAASDGGEFLLGLWSVDCPPCLVELRLMGGVLKRNPNLPYVLVSTDPIEDRDLAAEFLEDLGLAGIESWMFADHFVERLRHSIDPNWYGELPRSYFFDGNGKRESHSGIVDEKLLASWFKRPLIE